MWESDIEKKVFLFFHPLRASEPLVRVERDGGGSETEKHTFKKAKNIMEINKLWTCCSLLPGSPCPLSRWPGCGRTYGYVVHLFIKVILEKNACASYNNMFYPTPSSAA